MAKKRKTVSYVVGATLDAPVVVTHVLPEEEREPKPQVNSHQHKSKADNRFKKQVKSNIRCTCGHAQKEARIIHNERQKKIAK